MHTHNTDTQGSQTFMAGESRKEVSWSRRGAQVVIELAAHVALTALQLHRRCQACRVWKSNDSSQGSESLQLCPPCMLAFLPLY